VNLLLYSLIILSPLENVDSDASVDAGMANISRAILESTGCVAEEDFLSVF
jgi:hypothetical protein